MKHQQANIFKMMLFCFTFLFFGLMNASVAHAGLVLPAANFSSNITEGYPPLDVQFTNLSTNATHLEWNFGDGSSNITDPNPVHQFTFTGSFNVTLTASNSNGSDSITKTIDVLEKPKAPKANFTSDVTSGYAPLSVQFTDQSEEADDLEWNFGDGSSDVYDPNPVHVFTSPGLFIVTLIATSGDGSNSKSMEITVYEKSGLPVANFTSNVTDGSAPLDVQFNDLSQNASWWNWDFGDGSSIFGDDISVKNPIHTYTEDGNYTVNLTVNNSNGTDSKLATITVSPPAPVANFTSNVTEGFVPLNVQFTDCSSNSAEWNWDFGDGTSSNERNPIHTYSVNGTYNVTQTVKNEKGTNSKSSLIVVKIYRLVTEWGSQGSGIGQFHIPSGVDVDSSGNVYVADLKNNRIQIFDSNGNFITQWETLNSSDIAIDSSGDVYVTGYSTPSVVKYDRSGNVIRKWGSLGNGDGQFQYPVSVDVDKLGNVYVADMDNSRIEKFDSNGTYITQWSIFSYHLGAPTGIAVDDSGNVYVVVHNMNCIEKFDSDGKLISILGSYGINDGQFYEPFSVDVDKLGNLYVIDELNHRIQVLNSTGSFITKWSGVFGNAVGIAVDLSGNVYVSNYGTYSVQKYAPSDLPIAYFTSNVSQGFPPLSVQFTDLSKNANAWYWDFGDGNTSVERNPAHKYYEKGSFTVTLTASNENGKNSKSATIDVSKLPVANFSTNVTSGNVPLTVQFTDLSESADSWHWEFGDGNTSIEHNPVHTYKMTGNYTVNLTAINETGTFDTFNQTIFVNGFRPNPNGYQFVNTAATPYSTTDFHNIYNLSVDITKKSSPITFFYNNYFRNLSEGQCFGMSATSVLLYNHQINNTYSYNKNDATPNDWTEFNNFFNDYIPYDLGIWIYYYQPLSLDKACLDDFCTYAGVKMVYDTLSQHLSNDKYDMVMVFTGDFYNTTNNSYDPFCHAVVPYRIDESSDGQTAKIFVYDCNSPGDFNEFFEFNKNTWNISGYFSGTTFVDNITVVSLYSLKAITESPKMPSNVYSIDYCPAHILFTDGSGRKLGYDNGVLKHEIHGTCPILIPNTETKADLKESYYVPVPSIKMELYGRGNGISETSMITPNGLIVANVPVTTSSVDEFKVLNNGTGVYFNSENSNTPSLDLMLDIETPRHSQTVNANISQIEAYGSVNLSNINGIIILQNNGLARTCNMSIEQATGTQYSSVTINNITIEASSTIYIEPSDWNNLSGSTVIIKHDVGSDGTIDYIQNGQQNPIPLILPVANFTSKVSDTYAWAFTFYDYSENATWWKWDFGDGTNISGGNSSSIKNPYHIYQKEGTYTVNLTVSNANGTSSKNAQINVQPVLPIPNFSANVTFGHAPLCVHFTDLTENTTYVRWDFGDGSKNYVTSSFYDDLKNIPKNPDHTFSTPGAYAVTLEATNNNSISNKIVLINVDSYTNVSTWGSKGSGDGQFDFTTGSGYLGNNNGRLNFSNGTGLILEPDGHYYNIETTCPYGVAVDSSGNVYVADSQNHRIQKFDSSGNFITKWGSYGTGNGQYIYPKGVAVDSSGNVYVADSHNNRIQKFDSNGNFITKWGSYGTGNGQLIHPYGVAVDSSGNVYVAQKATNVIQKFDSSGKFLTKWGSYGTGNGQFFDPRGIAVDSSGNVYVADYGYADHPENTRIQKFDSNGNFTTKWGSLIDEDIFPQSSNPKEDGKFIDLNGIAVDSSGNIYVADSSRIQKFDSNGKFLTKWGSSDLVHRLDYISPAGVAVDSSGNVYISNYDMHCIQKFAPFESFFNVNFTGNITQGPVPLSVQFTDLTGNADSWNWDFGDGFTSNEQNPIHTYYTKGNYTVTLTAGYVNGASSKTAIIHVLEQPGLPVSNFTSNVTSGNVPLTVQFTDLSENATKWNWDFGDSANSTERNVSHTYISAGSFTVNLTVSNANGTSSKTTQINVSTVLPVANFTSNVTSGNVPLTVQFTDLSENATKWSWDFGDSANSTERNVSHTYTAVGSFTVNLTVSNENGTSSKTVQINPKSDIINVGNYTFVTKWGVNGAGIGQPWGIAGIAVDTAGDVYVAESYGRIQILNSSGGFKTNWYFFNGVDHPSDLGFDSFGNVYVLQSGSSRIDKLDRSGKLILQWGSSGTSNGQFNNSNGIAVDSENNVYVSDSNNHRIQRFSGNGTFLTKWGSYGTGNGQFSYPSGIAVDSKNNVYVVDKNNHRIQKFDSNGNFITKWGSYGTGNGQFNTPGYLDVDSSGNVYVSDTINHRIQKFDSNGGFITKWGSYGTGDGQFQYVRGIAVDSSGNVYVGDDQTSWGNEWFYERVQKFVIDSKPVLPVANFTSNVTEGYTPLSVQFTDLSQNATGWNWNFGDGSSSSERNITHTYSLTGICTVNLTVSNTNGTSSKTMTINITSKPVPINPIANFTSNVTQGYAPLDVKFTNLSSNATHLEWNFGDGSVNVSDSNPEHLFTSTGQFNVVLTASNGNGSDSKSMTINVTSKPVLPVLPTAVIGTNTTNGTVPLTVQFSDLSLNATGRIWEFGDGGANSIDINPIHTYNLVGIFTVNLTASNGNGSDSKYVVINVTSKPLQPVLPVTNFSSNVTEGYAPLDVQFTDLSENANEWKWDFGDGNNSSDQSPIHIYSAPGTYTVNLTASNSNGSDSKFMTINVTSKPVLIIPVANFSSNVNEGYAPLDVQFIDLSQNATHLEWNFGDGSTNVSDQNPEHLFTSTGSFNVVLTASNGNGSDSKSMTINVTSKPVSLVFPVAKFNSNIIQQPALPIANFISNVTGGLVPLSVQFTDQSINTTGWNWDFGDGNISTDKSPMHTYYTAGNYTVNLTVSNGNFRDSKLAVINVSAQTGLLVIRSVVLFPANTTAGSKINVTVAADDVRVVGVTAGNTSLTKDNNGLWQGNITAPSKTGKYSLLINANDVAGSIWNTSMPYNVVQLQGGAYIKTLPKSSTVNTVYAPISVQFIDLSEYAAEWRWDFGDGNNSTDQSPMHTYSTSGNYTVNLTVSNANGTNSTSDIVNAPTISARNLVSLNIQVTNTQNIDDTFKLRISVSELPVSSQSDLNWFSWTDYAISLRAGQTGQVPVYVTIPANTATGLKAFRANMTSGVSKITGFDTGYLTIK